MKTYCSLILACWTLLMLLVVFPANSNNLYGKSQQKIETSISFDTIDATNNKITKQHLLLTSPSNFLYIIPPDKSFEIVTEIGKYGLFSEKYNASMPFRYQMVNEYVPVEKEFINMVIRDKDLLMNKLVKSTNDLLIRYAKTKKVRDGDTVIIWYMACGNVFFGLTADLTYNVKYDKKFSKKVENMFKSIIAEPNPYITPATKVPFITGDYELLGLNLVKRLGSIAYFTEDGRPLHRSKGTKVALLSSVLYSIKSGYRSMERSSIDGFDLLMRMVFPNETIIPFSVREVEEISEIPTLRIEAYFQSNDSRSIVAYCSPTDKFVHIICGICDEKEADEFFQVIDKFKKTVTF